MKRLTFFIISLFFVLIMPLASNAEVNVSIGIPAPLVFSSEPDLVVVPSGDADVYMVPDSPGLYFYDNYWYRFDRDRWYRSDSYDGGWGYVETNLVPGFIIDIPPDYYLQLPRGYHRIHYRDFRGHWRDWHRNHYWDKQGWYKNQRREHERWRREHHDGRDGKRDHDMRDHDKRGHDMRDHDKRGHDMRDHDKRGHDMRDRGKHDGGKGDGGKHDGGKHDGGKHDDKGHEGR